MKEGIAMIRTPYMKKTIALILLIVAIDSGICLAWSVVGSGFGALGTARALGQGKTNLGLSVGLADDRSFSGYLTYGMSKYMDGRFKLGIRDDGAARFTLGADFKWQFWTVGGRHNEPLDMAIGGLLEFTDHGHGSTIHVGGHLTGSYPFQLNTGGTISPYGRFNVRTESQSWDTGYDYIDGRRSRTHLQFGLNAGVAWSASSVMDLYGEFQFDGNDGVFFGIDFNVM